MSPIASVKISLTSGLLPQSPRWRTAAFRLELVSPESQANDLFSARLLPRDNDNILDLLIQAQIA